MNKEQYDALMGKLDSFGTKLNELETKVATFGKQPEADKKDDLNVDDKGDKTGDDKGAAGITAQQFSKLETMLTGFSDKLVTKCDKFNKLSASARQRQTQQAKATTLQWFNRCHSELTNSLNISSENTA